MPGSSSKIRICTQTPAGVSASTETRARGSVMMQRHPPRSDPARSKRPAVRLRHRRHDGETEAAALAVRAADPAESLEHQLPLPVGDPRARIVDR